MDHHLDPMPPWHQEQRRGFAMTIAALLLCTFISVSFMLLSRDRPPPAKPEPWTWCEKRLLGYLMISQELTLYNDGSGELKCRYSRGDKSEPPSPPRK